MVKTSLQTRVTTWAFFSTVLCLTACGEQTEQLASSIEVSGVKALEPQTLPRAVRARYVAVSAVAALTTGNGVRIVALVPPEERDQLRRRLSDSGIRAALFKPQGWRREFFARWSGTTYEATFTPTTGAVRVGQHGDDPILVRLRWRDGRWYFQELALEFTR